MLYGRFHHEGGRRSDEAVPHPILSSCPFGYIHRGIRYAVLFSSLRFSVFGQCVVTFEDLSAAMLKRRSQALSMYVFAPSEGAEPTTMPFRP